MFILGNLLSATAQVLSIVLKLYMWIIIIRALLSWVNPDPYNPIVQFLYSITEPVLYRVRQLIPMSGMGIDFAPIVVLLAIIFPPCSTLCSSWENLHSILLFRVYSRKLITSNRSGSQHRSTAVYVDHYYPRPVVLGEPGSA